jgi:hypothetical protein
MEKKLYEELRTNYRYFLTWRHAAIIINTYFQEKRV